MFLRALSGKHAAPEGHVVCDGACVRLVQSCPLQYLEDGGFNFAGFESRVLL